MNSLDLKNLNTVTPENLKYSSQVTRITRDLAKKSVGKKIIFKTDGVYIIREILGVSDTGRTIKLDYPRLRDNLQTGRAIYILKD
jgi:hypothetical protein